MHSLIAFDCTREICSWLASLVLPSDLQAVSVLWMLQVLNLPLLGSDEILSTILIRIMQAFLISL